MSYPFPYNVEFWQYDQWNHFDWYGDMDEAVQCAILESGHFEMPFRVVDTEQGAVVYTASGRPVERYAICWKEFGF